MKKFASALKRAKTEEGVKNAYVKHYGWPFDASSKQDLRVEKVLFEFKLDVDLKDVQKRAKVLAQAMHYVGRMYLGIIPDAIPSAIVAADRNEACVLRMEKCQGLLGSEAIDWTRAPSSPDPALVDAMAVLCASTPVYSLERESDVKTFGEEVSRINIGAPMIGKPITIATVMDAWDGWLETVGPYIRENDAIKADVFKEDMMKEVLWFEGEGRLKGVFSGKTREYYVPKDVYEGFWAKWERPPSAEEAERIYASADRFKPMMQRRMTGKFHTPMRFARMALEYMDRLIPGWREKVLYDPCAGTGNLEFLIGCSKNTWLSTLEQPDVDYLKSAAIAPPDQCFKIDYLADTPLFDGMDNAPKPEIILMNPPYGEHGAGGQKTPNKTGISVTQLKSGMSGMPARELFAQFMFRVQRDHPNATVCLFSKAKFMTSPSYAGFRKDIWRYRLLGGFCFPGTVFDGVKGKFPVLFTAWEPADQYDGDTPLDIINANGEKIGQKVFGCPTLKLLDWVSRPTGKAIPMLPIKSPVQVTTGKLTATTLPSSAYGYLVNTGPDVQQNGGQWCFSSVYGGGRGLPITPNNFNRAIMMWAVRKLVQGNWINDRDQYSIPHTEPPKEWQNDCLAFCLIHGSNQTSSLRGIEYDGKKWDVKNEWVVPTLDTIRQFNTTSPWMRGWLRSASKDSHISNQLLSLYPDMSDEGRACIDAILAVWKVFFENAHLLDLDKFKIEDWDAGWWQIRNALKDRGIGLAELKAADQARHALKEKLLPGVYEYGFLPMEKLIETKDDIK